VMMYHRRWKRGYTQAHPWCHVIIPSYLAANSWLSYSVFLFCFVSPTETTSQFLMIVIKGDDPGFSGFISLDSVQFVNKVPNSYFITDFHRIMPL
jgi:hypothetical protein